MKEAATAIDAGYAGRMMLELAPDQSFGVLSPAFKGNERGFALQRYAANGCTFLSDKHCGLHGTGLQPIECRFCHHDRPGLGAKCHADLEQDWQTPAARAHVRRWGTIVGLWVKWGIEPL